MKTTINHHIFQMFQSPASTLQTRAPPRYQRLLETDQPEMMQKNKQLQTALQSTVLAAKIAGINTAPVTKTKVSGGDDADVFCRVFFYKNGGKSSMKSWMLNIQVYCI
jgi:hypothetical protein